ncbi:hypothetical protein MKL09_21375 [Methylobacterium sp. J-048]|uniref:hypothetical protein n=1 Tax=Methylobacterium sp. J-048 TaxID=2836635 RepID=UPI001FB8FAFB|nr:hypothetical protein [Methylobacterium sp. J-048]MCJ2059079.1 hypothetical protein [Methylobacterium sp. J-048]
MRLDLGHKGDWIVDPRELASRLGVSMAVLKRQERLGQVEAWIKAGSQADQTCVTVRLHGKGWRGTFDGSGALISEERW